MRTFEIGATYKALYKGDHTLYDLWTVIKRTANTITVTDGKTTKTCKIIKELSEMNGAEHIRPIKGAGYVHA